MILRRLLPVVVILAGVAVVALLGGGWIDRDRDARLADEARALREEAASIARARENLLSGAAAEFRSDGGAGRRAYLDPAGAVFPRAAEPAPAPEIRHRLDRAREMGDRLAAAGDPLRAVDAYTLPLAQISDPRLCAPLLFAAARAAIASEELAPWGRATLAMLREAPFRGVVDPEIGPIDLVATLALPPNGARPVTGADLLARLESAPVHAITALAARFRGRPGWIDDPSLDTALVERSREREAILRHAEGLRTGRPALDDGLFILPLAESGAGSIEIALDDIGAFLPLPSERYELVEVGPSVRGSETADRVEFPIEIDGVPIARIALRDREASVRQAAIERRARTLRLVLWAVLAVVSGAFLATWLALDRERRLAALKVRLLANVSHELKTPVTSIRMLGELLQSPALPRERVEEFGALITRESQRLGRRIEEILETAWARESAAPLATVEVELRAVVDEVAGRFRTRAEGAGGTIEVVAAGQPPELETNRDALERIVENLLDNALKYGRRRAAGIDAGNGAPAGPRIAIIVAGEPGVVRVTVEDDGPGIPVGEGERIFEPFYRAAFDDFAVPGTGLGLSISRSFADRLGGSLVHTPRPGGGSRFTLTLPCRVEG